MRTSVLTLVMFAWFSGRANISFDIVHEHCSNASGSVITQVTGGVPPYAYSWSSGQTTQHIYGLVAGSYTLTVTDDLGAQQVSTAVVENLSAWEWNADNVSPEAWMVPPCDGGAPFGYVFFKGYPLPHPGGPSPHMFDQECMDWPQFPYVPSDFEYWDCTAYCMGAQAGSLFTVNYWDANGCPGHIELQIPQTPEFLPVSVLDVEGSCSGGANGRLRFSCPHEQDWFILFAHLFNDQWQEMPQYENESVNWVGGYTFDITGLPAGTYAFVRRLVFDPDYVDNYPCGDTVYMTVPDLGPLCGNVSGQVRLDVDEDCVLDNGDTRIPQMLIEFTPGPYYATTNTLGEYNVNLPLGSYMVTQQTSVVDEHCLSDPITLDLIDNATLNFLDTSVQALDVQLGLASGPARPGFELHYAIDLDNLSSGNSGSNALMMSFDPVLTVIGSTPTGTVNGNTISWSSLASLSYFGHRDVTVRLQVPPDVSLIGSVLEATATVTPSGNDVNAANNTMTIGTTVTGSYDPNEKAARTSSHLSDLFFYIDQDEWIDYTIRFQNTGTDTAFTVVLTDTLPAPLNPGSLQIGAASHPFTWELRDSGTLKFYFVNILLPDSNANEPASHGFVSFRVRPEPDLPLGTLISNTANIFFDFNPAIITDPSVLVAELSTGVQEQGYVQVQLFPNPAGDQLTLISAVPVMAAEAIAADGRLIRLNGTFGHTSNVDVLDLAPGPYVMRIALVNKTFERVRFIKQ
jgi:uncharacterized repeat protein (TIGR01451 family)